MRRACVLAVLSFVACAPGEVLVPRTAAATPEPDAAAPTPPPTADPLAGPSPGHDLVASPMAPGHYATDVHYHQESACSQSWEHYASHASLLLDLAPDGGATACRGKHMNEVGPDFHIEVMEQQGFRGTWRRDGAWVDVNLALADEPSCPELRGYTNREPEAWHLRCVALTPAPGAASPVAVPVAGCQFASRVYTEELGYVVQSLLDGEWVLLSSGNGLRVVSDQPMPWDRVAYEVAPSTTPVAFDAWRAP